MLAVQKKKRKTIAEQQRRQEDNEVNSQTALAMWSKANFKLTAALYKEKMRSLPIFWTDSQIYQWISIIYQREGVLLLLLSLEQKPCLLKSSTALILRCRFIANWLYNTPEALKLRQETISLKRKNWISSCFIHDSLISKRYCFSFRKVKSDSLRANDTAIAQNRPLLWYLVSAHSIDDVWDAKDFDLFFVSRL